MDSSQSSNEKAPQRAQAQPFTARTRRRSSASIRLLTSACICFCILLNRQFGRDIQGTRYTLCTRGSARIYTVDDSRPTVECIAVDGKHIVATGSHGAFSSCAGLRSHAHGHADEVSAHRFSGYGPLSRLISTYIFPARIVPTGSVLPGLSDSHTHILLYGQSRQLDVREAKSPEDVVARIREYILARPDVLKDKSIWIEGAGFDHTIWPGGHFPTASDFEADDIVKGRPVVIHSKDAHAFWVSQRIIDEVCPCADMGGGIITRDGNGKEAGIFADDAREYIPIPPPSEKTKEEWFTTTMQDAVEHGITGMHHALLEPEYAPFFIQMADENKIPLRLYAMRIYDANSTYWGDKVEIIDGRADNRLSIRSIKIVSDGALRSGGAALYEPYNDNPSTRGFMRISSEELHEVIPKFMKDGWQVNTHAIGDRANGIFLDVIGSIEPQIVKALRPRVEHAQIVSPPDLNRFGELGVIASVQPTHATDDMWYAEDRLGPERIKGTYAFKSLQDGGARLAFGSDIPVEEISPFAGFYAAITRVTAEGKSPHGSEGWFPEQRLTRTDALKALTLNPAYASFTDHITGSLQPGKRADFVVLDRDIMTVPVAEILGTKVVATAVDGRTVYGKI
ncbi:hypothetical protein AURDEDRAFT_143337 [Auricularia subglabra TFB-10046 SS5]|nr:hypothetical protein AURDEDRAFT_143337 [Auricularia subglabra TFB-10046 SS5]